MALGCQMKMFENLEMESSQADILNVYFLFFKQVYSDSPFPVGDTRNLNRRSLGAINFVKSIIRCDTHKPKSCPMVT